MRLSEAVRPFRKAIGAAVGAGLATLAATLPDGVTKAEAWLVAAAVVGGAAATWAAPPNVPADDTPDRA